LPSASRPSQANRSSARPRHTKLRTSRPAPSFREPVQNNSSDVSWKNVTTSLLPSPFGENTASSAFAAADGVVTSTVMAGDWAFGLFPLT
jgi:hypothetical protein